MRSEMKNNNNRNTNKFQKQQQQQRIIKTNEEAENSRANSICLYITIWRTQKQSIELLIVVI